MTCLCFCKLFLTSSQSLNKINSFTSSLLIEIVETFSQLTLRTRWLLIFLLRFWATDEWSLSLKPEKTLYRVDWLAETEAHGLDLEGVRMAQYLRLLSSSMFRSCLEVIILSIGWEASIIYSVENFLKQLMLSLCNAFFFSLSLTLSLSLSWFFILPSHQMWGGQKRDQDCIGKQGQPFPLISKFSLFHWTQVTFCRCFNEWFDVRANVSRNSAIYQWPKKVCIVEHFYTCK